MLLPHGHLLPGGTHLATNQWGGHLSDILFGLCCFIQDSAPNTHWASCLLLRGLGSGGIPHALWRALLSSYQWALNPPLASLLYQWCSWWLSGHWWRTCLTLLGYLAVADFLATFSRLTFVCGFPRYLYQPLISAMFPLGSLTPTVLTTFPILVTIWPPLSRLKNILWPSLWQSTCKCFKVLHCIN